MESPGRFLIRLAHEAWEREQLFGPLPEDNLTLRQAEDLLRRPARKAKPLDEAGQILVKPYFTGERDGGIDV